MKTVRYQSVKLPSLWVSSLTSLLVVVVFALNSNEYYHWFVIPVVGCGALIGKDAVDWLRGRYSTFDPIGIIGMIGWHFFFLAPLLHVYWDRWMRGVAPPNEWRDWLGAMAVINVLGLLAYQGARRIRWRKAASSLYGPRYKWSLSVRQFTVAVLPALALTLFLQLWVYAQFGGIMGYIAAFESQTQSFRGMGWIFMISESFPILAVIAYAVAATRYKRLRSWKVVLLVFVAFVLLKLMFGGLRGSRANILWGLFWGAGIIHFWVRPLTRKFALLGIVFLVPFAYVYGLYKGAGSDVVRITEGIEAVRSLEDDTNRNLHGVLLGDLARADVQAFLLYRLFRPDADYEHAWGRTYVGALALLVPSSVWPNRPPHKAKEGTEIQYGRGSYTSSFESTRQYGLAGEVMLNFGVFPIVLVYALFGVAVRWMHRWVHTWPEGDARFLLLPFLINLLFVVLVSDSDNIIVFLVKNGVVPLAVIALACKRVRRANTSPSPDAVRHSSYEGISPQLGRGSLSQQTG